MAFFFFLGFPSSKINPNFFLFTTTLVGELDKWY
jgi:hypothetical protein